MEKINNSSFVNIHASGRVNLDFEVNMNVDMSQDIIDMMRAEGEQRHECRLLDKVADGIGHGLTEAMVNSVRNNNQQPQAPSTTEPHISEGLVRDLMGALEGLNERLKALEKKEQQCSCGGECMHKPTTTAKQPRKKAAKQPKPKAADITPIK